MLMGCAFLGIKYVEYKQKFDHHLIPGLGFDISYHANHPLPGDSPSEIEEEKRLLERGLSEDPDLNAHAQLYFSLYFGMTGLHALHMIVGVGLMLWLVRQSFRGRFGAEYNTPVEIVGLYWHFVDIIWIYLFALLYLINRNVR